MGLMTLPAAAIAQPVCTIAAEHRTDDWSISSMAGNALTVDEGGNWVLTLTFNCTGITNLSTHDPEILIEGLIADRNLWKDNNNNRFTGYVWNQDDYGPTSFNGTKPTGDFSARVHLNGTSVDNNCHDSGSQTMMTFTAKIENTHDSTNMATRSFTVTARDDDPLQITLSPGKPWERTIDWKAPCS